MKVILNNVLSWQVTGYQLIQFNSVQGSMWTAMEIGQIGEAYITI